MKKRLPFTNTQQGSEFARLIANQILKSFIEQYNDADFSHTLSPAKFASFASKIVESMGQSSKAVLQQGLCVILYT